MSKKPFCLECGHSSGHDITCSQWCEPLLISEKQSDAKGIYRKYDVRRTDGRDKPGEKHCGCVYFVLDVMHDKFAAAALRAYAEACKDEFPELSRDVFDMAEMNDYESGRKVNQGEFPPPCYRAALEIIR